MNARIGNFYYVRNYLAFFCPISPKVCSEMAGILFIGDEGKASPWERG